MSPTTPAPDATPAQPVSAAGSEPVAWRCRSNHWLPGNNWQFWSAESDRTDLEHCYDTVEPLALHSNYMAAHESAVYWKDLAERHDERIGKLEAELSALRATPTPALVTAAQLEEQGYNRMMAVLNPVAEAERYLEDLLKILAAKHYPDVPQFKPLSGNLIGMLTQIDNMTTGLVRTPALAPREGIRAAAQAVVDAKRDGCNPMPFIDLLRIALRAA